MLEQRRSTKLGGKAVPYNRGSTEVEWIFWLQNEIAGNCWKYSFKEHLGCEETTTENSVGGRKESKWGSFDSLWWILSLVWLIENWLCMQKGYVLLRETFFPFVFMKSALLQMLLPSHTKASLIYNSPHCFKSAMQISCFSHIQCF